MICAVGLAAGEESAGRAAAQAASGGTAGPARAAAGAAWAALALPGAGPGARDGAGVRGRRRVHRVGRRARERRHQCRGAHREGDPARQEPDPGQQQRRDQPDHEHQVLQPGQEVGAAVEEREAEHRGQGDRAGRDAHGEQRVAPLPQQPGAGADERRDRRGQRHGVVGVEDAGHEAEGQRGDHQPGAPDHEPGADQVGAGVPAGEPQTRPRAAPARPGAATRPGRRSRSRTAAGCPSYPSPRRHPAPRRRRSRSRRR